MKNSVSELQKLLRAMTADERERFASSASTSVAYLYQIAGGHRKAGMQLALRIERASGGAVSRKHLRPEFFFETEAA